MYSALNETKGISDIKYKEPHSRATVNVRPNGNSQGLIYSRSRIEDTKHRKGRRGTPKCPRGGRILIMKVFVVLGYILSKSLYATHSNKIPLQNQKNICISKGTLGNHLLIFHMLSGLLQKIILRDVKFQYSIWGTFS